MAVNNPPVNAIMVECAIAVGKGLGDKKVPTRTAEFWAAKYEKSIAEALLNKGVWARDRRKVLVVAKKLGEVSRRLAGSSDSVSVPVAREASDIVSEDKLCPGGGGKYCPPH
jgi:hypothetical protein